MPHSTEPHHSIPETTTSHPDNPIPEEPEIRKTHKVSVELPNDSPTSTSFSSVSSENGSPSTPHTEPQIDEDVEHVGTSSQSAVSLEIPRNRKRCASTALISSNQKDVLRLLGTEGGTKLVEKICCGGGCCFFNSAGNAIEEPLTPIQLPDNDAFRSLRLQLGPLSLDTKLASTIDPPEQTVSFETLEINDVTVPSTVFSHPPKFVTPHPPYDVYPAKLHYARELTKPGAERRTYHFDLDVTDYPKESGEVDFVVGGAIGVCAPNSDELVDEIFNALNIPNYARDKQIKVRTSTGRWPTIWGDDMPRELITTRRELLTWCSDVQSYPPTKQLLRLLGEYAEDPNEKQILLYLCSAQGQGSFCDLRTGPHITLSHLLHAFPSSRPPLPYILSVLNQLMPRFYSLSQDPQISCAREGTDCRRLVEIAVTVHESENWRGGPRTGVGSGYLERMAQKVIEAERGGIDSKDLDLYVPMFRGLMANPLAREFVHDGPMLLIGAGVGIAPFRGFVQRRLKSANCANKVWVLQGVRDSLLDELYSGEWGGEEDKVKKVVQSRRGEGKYVQEEVRNQADLVWFIINALDGRVFVCGSSKGMGEGVESALIDVAMDKGNLNREAAEAFWTQKKGAGQYIAETW
ncbi:MAG: hypothetical protein MMC33_007157 [Icmadophila ericetorum]|nr:hypothetical protein [Icmadophila ericetorum]